MAQCFTSLDGSVLHAVLLEDRRRIRRVEATLADGVRAAEARELAAEVAQALIAEGLVAAPDVVAAGVDAVRRERRPVERGVRGGADRDEVLVRRRQRRR